MGTTRRSSRQLGSRPVPSTVLGPRTRARILPVAFAFSSSSFSSAAASLLRTSLSYILRTTSRGQACLISVMISPSAFGCFQYFSTCSVLPLRRLRFLYHLPLINETAMLSLLMYSYSKDLLCAKSLPCTKTTVDAKHSPYLLEEFY